MFGIKFQSLTLRLYQKLHDLSAIEVKGISSVVVKYVDIGRNTGGESALLG